jgi:hypothetical protein
MGIAPPRVGAGAEFVTFDFDRLSLQHTQEHPESRSEPPE